LNNFFLFLFLIATLTLNGCKNSDNNSQIITHPYNDQNQYKLIYKEELPIEDYRDWSVTKDKIFTGTQTLHIDSQIEFSKGFKKQIGSIENFQMVDSIEIKFQFLSENKFKNIKLVCSIDDNNGNNKFWNGNLIDFKSPNIWNEMKVGFKINPDFIEKNNIINIYLWNPNKEEIWIDDFGFKLFGINKVVDVSIDSKCNYFNDFENTKYLLRSEKVKETTAHSGKFSCDLSDGSEYGISVNNKFEEFSKQIIKKVAASIWIYPTEPNHNLILTFSIKDKKTGESKFWYGKESLHGIFPLNKWTLLNCSVNLPVEIINLEDEIEVGLWNKGKTSVFCDDMHIVYGDEPERKSNLIENNQTFNNSGNADKINYKRILECNFLSYNTTKLEGIKYITPSDKLVAGKFYEHQKGLESILHVNKESAKLWWFNQNKKIFDLVWETNDKNNFILKPSNYIAAGDFDGDQIGDLLIVNKNDLTWAIYNLEKLQWRLKLTGKNYFPRNWIEEIDNISLSNKLSSSKKTQFLNFTKQNLETLSLDNGSWISSKQELGMPGTENYTDDILLDWNENYFLKLNTNWRFDLKQVDIKNNNITEKYFIDFKKDEKGVNPKYYEKTILLSGHFLNTNNKQLLLVYYNCINENFDGRNCFGIENNNEFPNGINFYN
jgi:hypothetical protein